MPSEMFGSPIGDIAARETFLKEALGAANIASLAASAKLHEQQAAKIQQESEAQQKLMAAWNKRKQAAAAEAIAEPVAARLKKPSSDFWDAADEAANVGQFEMARKLADTASLIDKRLADEASTVELRRKNQFLNRKNELEAVQGALRQVTDEASFQDVNRWYEETFGRPSPVAGQRYSPELIKRLSNSVLTEKAQIELDLRRRDLNSKMADRADAAATRKSRLSLEERRVAAIEEREARLAKAGGGKPMAGASKTAVGAAARLIVNGLFPGQTLDDLPEDAANEISLGAKTIADEAKKLQRNNPALTETEAIAQAFANSKRDGDWELTKRKLFAPSTWGGDSAKFRGFGKTPQAPMAVPEKASDLIAGRYYQNAKGQTAKYLGNGKFQAVATPAAGSTGRLDDEDEGEDEDEEE